MAKLDKIKPGDVLYDVHSERAGNTTMRRQGEWKVRVVSVHDDHAMCSWNGNPPRKYYAHALEKLRMNPAKKLNGHLRDCDRSTGMFSVRDCTCAELAKAASK